MTQQKISYSTQTKYSLKSNANSISIWKEEGLVKFNGGYSILATQQAKRRVPVFFLSAIFIRTQT